MSLAQAFQKAITSTRLSFWAGFPPIIAYWVLVLLGALASMDYSANPVSGAITSQPFQPMDYFLKVFGVMFLFALASGAFAQKRISNSFIGNWKQILIGAAAVSVLVTLIVAIGGFVFFQSIFGITLTLSVWLFAGIALFWKVE
jgi:hypothetical protein